MKKSIFIIITFTVLLSRNTYAGEFGMSFPFLFPKNGEYAVPVAPFHIKGFSFLKFNKYVSISTGIYYFRMSGVNISGLPYEWKKPLLGPCSSFAAPLDLLIKIPMGRTKLTLNGGGFGFINLGTKINYGNMNEALEQHLALDFVNSDFSLKNKFGGGWQAGAEFLYYINKKIGISIGCNYFAGGSALDLNGNYEAYSKSDNITTTGTLDYPEAKFDFTAWEFTIGGVYRN